MRKLEGKAVKLNLEVKPREESELEKQVKDDEVEKRLKTQANMLKWLFEKYDDVPDEYKKALGIK